jgi:hypothetical protein
MRVRIGGRPSGCKLHFESAAKGSNEGQVAPVSNRRSVIPTKRHSIEWAAFNIDETPGDLAVALNETLAKQDCKSGATMFSSRATGDGKI